MKLLRNIEFYPKSDQKNINGFYIPRSVIENALKLYRGSNPEMLVSLGYTDSGLLESDKLVGTVKAIHFEDMITVDIQVLDTIAGRRFTELLVALDNNISGFICGWAAKAERDLEERITRAEILYLAILNKSEVIQVTSTNS